MTEPVAPGPVQPPSGTRNELRTGLRWGAVVLTLALVVAAGILWTAHPPKSGTGPARSSLGPVTSTPGGRLTADPPLADVLQDQGNPVPLPDGGTLWLFADSAHLTKPFFFHTSTAAVTARGSTRLSYLRDRAALPTEFLPRTAGERAQQDSRGYVPIWPTGGTVLPDGRIIVSYAKWYVTRSPITFTFLSAGLYEYRYPGRPAEAQPAVRIADGLWTAGDGAVGSPVYVDGYVYLTVCEKLDCFALRTTPDRLTDRSGYTWWTGSDWSPRGRDRRPMTFEGNRPGRNPAIARLPSGIWAMTDTSAGGASGQGLLWVARTPYGPWSMPLAFTLPGCVSFGCYAVILHPQQSTDDRVRVGYATFDRSMYIHLVEVPISVRDSGGNPSVQPR